jgi:hypothetical protein
LVLKVTPKKLKEIKKHRKYSLKFKITGMTKKMSKISQFWQFEKATNSLGITGQNRLI